MKTFLKIFVILVVFFKTETLLSKNNLFNVNNIEIEKNEKTSNDSLANQAIKKGFDELINKILLKEDINKLSDLSFSSKKQLVTYYQVSNSLDEKENIEIAKFNITFDKVKIHELFYKRNIQYSKISDKDLFVLPVLIKNNELFVFNNNFFYQHWNEILENDLIEFILPLENIEIIQKINKFRHNLIDIELDNLFKEYPSKNLALILIDNTETKNKKVYFKTKIQGKNISKNLTFKKQDKSTDDLNREIIKISKTEIINLVKSENLIDIRTPSFINAKLIFNKKTNIVKFNSRIKNIELVENIYVQSFNKDFMNLRIKYLGKLDKVINQLKNENIRLEIVNDKWVLQILN